MAEVQIGGVKVGSIQQADIGDGPLWYVYRITRGRDIRVGDADNKEAALKLLGLSIVGQLQSEGSLTTTQRDKLRNLVNTLDGMGLSDLSRAVLETLS